MPQYLIKKAQDRINTTEHHYMQDLTSEKKMIAQSNGLARFVNGNLPIFVMFVVRTNLGIENMTPTIFV